MTLINIYTFLLYHDITTVLHISRIYINMLNSQPPGNLDKQTTITVDDKTFTVHADDLVKICDLGRGAYGIVEKMKHIPSNTTMAVKVRVSYSVFCSDNHAM